MRLREAKIQLERWLKETYGIHEDHDYVAFEMTTRGLTEQAVAVVGIKIGDHPAPRESCQFATDTLCAIVNDLPLEVVEAHRTIMNHHLTQWLDADQLRG